jgi:hypothetical protein
MLKCNIALVVLRRENISGICIDVDGNIVGL